MELTWDLTAALFAPALDTFAKICHKLAVKSGFWENGTRNKGEAIALIHSELSEMLEAARKPELVGHLYPDFTAEEEEAADALIRLMDYANGFNLRIGAATVAKLKFNQTRGHKHGKEF